MSIQIQDYKMPAFQPQRYIMSEPLKKAVEVAIALNQPLLLTGEPGTGKTLLAYKVAAQLAQQGGDYAFQDQPLVFHTKTTSSARDLFYTYDALGHFQSSNIQRGPTDPLPQTSDFIELQALGKAIALTDPTGIDSSNFRTDLGKQPKSSVVLIDEIDKAPRDFPNDLLAEIERYQFEIKERDNYLIQRNPQQRVVVIMTSNSEKNLPDAFLRRCVFFHIPFPDKDQLLAIAKSQLGEATPFTDELLQELIEKFKAIRNKVVRKQPATAELIAWLRMLELQEIFNVPEAERSERLRQHLSVLVKTKEDLDAVKELFA